MLRLQNVLILFLFVIYVLFGLVASSASLPPPAVIPPNRVRCAGFCRGHGCHSDGGLCLPQGESGAAAGVRNGFSYYMRVMLIQLLL